MAWFRQLCCVMERIGIIANVRSHGIQLDIVGPAPFAPDFTPYFVESKQA
jgi:hypothetical protein